MKNPEIRINFADLLYWGESQALNKAYSGAGEKIISESEAIKKTEAYRQAWRLHEDKILSAMQEILGLQFYRRVIDVNLAPGFVSKSEPLIINFRHSPDQFVDVLTHELFHVLLTDNTKISTRTQKTDLISVWENLFGSNHSLMTLVHIPVHAGCKYIFTDILNEPERAQMDIDDIKTWAKHGKDYLESWDYVNTHDYKKILSDLEATYDNL